MVSTTVFVRYAQSAFGITLIVMLVLGQCAAVVRGDLQPHESGIDRVPASDDDGGAAAASDLGVVRPAEARLVDEDADGGDSVAAALLAAEQNGNAAAGVVLPPDSVVAHLPPADNGDTVIVHNNGDSKTSHRPQSNGDAAYANLGFVHGFLASLSVILVSELGDKTFFIAAIMAMRHPRLVVFVGAIGALGLMTVLSVVFGMAATIIPRVYTYYISTALFAIFGLKMLSDGWKMSPSDAQEELEEVQMDLKKREDEREAEGGAGATGPTAEGLVQADDLEAGGGGSGSSAVPVERVAGSGTAANNRRLKSGARSLWSCLTSRVLAQAFTMTFVAEWGDRSQLTTIILGAREDAYGVIVGGVLGHMFCTGLAVIGGRMIAQRISVRTVTLVGGVVFLVFALSSLFISPNEEVPNDV